MTTGSAFCATCGTPWAAADQKFCSVCGSALSPVAPPPPPAPPTPVAPPALVAPPVAPPPVAPPPVWPAPLYTGSPAFAVSSVPAATGTGVKMLRRAVMVLGILLVVVLVAVSYLGVAQVPVLSSAFGMDHPRDLHMVRDPAALDALCAKWGVDKPSPTQNYTLSSKHHYSGTVQIDDTISEGAIAARPEFIAPNDNFSQVQFRIHEGLVEMSAFVNVPGYPASGPVYAQFSISVTSPRSVAIDFSQLEFGRIGVPGNVVDTVKARLNEYVNERLLDMGVTIDTLQLHEGGIRFKGTWPKTITADPPNPAGVP